MGLIVDAATSARPACFKALSDDSIACIIVLQLNRRLALNPTLHAARKEITDEFVQRAKSGTLLATEFHAALSKLA